MPESNPLHVLVSVVDIHSAWFKPRQIMYVEASNSQRSLITSTLSTARTGQQETEKGWMRIGLFTEWTNQHEKGITVYIVEQLFVLLVKFPIWAGAPCFFVGHMCPLVLGSLRHILRDWLNNEDNFKEPFWKARWKHRHHYKMLLES